MKQYKGKRNTISNIENIEELSIEYETPESIYLKKHESESDENDDIYNYIISLDILDNIDISVLKNNISRHDAAAMQGVSYDAYSKRLQRKVQQIKDIMSDFA